MPVSDKKRAYVPAKNAARVILPQPVDAPRTHSIDGMTAMSKAGLMRWQILARAPSLFGTVFHRPGGMI